MRHHTQGRYEELLETALHLFHKKGFHATSMQDIASGMGLRKASLYHYIDAKEDLLVSIYQRTISEYGQRIDSIVNGQGTARERLLEAIASHLESIVLHADMFAVYLSEHRSLPPRHRDAAREASRNYRMKFEKVIRQGIETGEFKDVDAHLSALVILGACNWLPQWYSPTGKKSAEEIVELYTEVLLQGLEQSSPE